MTWMLMPFRRYADFNGRSRRMEYWMWALFNLIVASLFAIPLSILVISAFRDVAAHGGVVYHSPYESTTDKSDVGVKPPPDDIDIDMRRSGDNDAAARPDDGAQGNASGIDDDRGTGAGSDNGGEDRSDKVGALSPSQGVNGGILAYSYSGGSVRWSAEINPFMFLDAFGTVGWALLGLSFLWSLITFIPNISVAIRRLHDIDRSGWWLFIGLVPLVGFIVLLVFLFTEGTRGGNRFGPDPKAAPLDTTFA